MEREDLQLLKHFIHNYSRYLPDAKSLEEKEEVLALFKEDVFRALTGPAGEPLAWEQMEMRTVHHYGIFHIALTK